MPVDQALAAAEGTAASAVAAPVRGAAPLAAFPVPFGFTQREVEVLHFLILRYTDKEIAAVLSISPRTVDRHVSGILNKLGVNSRREAAIFAARHEMDRSAIPPPTE